MWLYKILITVLTLVLVLLTAFFFVADNALETFMALVGMVATILMVKHTIRMYRAEA